MSETADRLRQLFDSAPNARLILAEGEIVLDVPEKSTENTDDDLVVVVLTREALLEHLGGDDATQGALDEFAPVVDDMAAKLGA